jgi:glycosyltransferase involved in cell wall biosynthesis
MLRGLAGHKEVELAVAWASRVCKTRLGFTADGVQYYVFPEPGRFVRGEGILRKATEQLDYVLGPVRNRQAVAEAVAVVEDYDPGLVHAFGTESSYGLIAPLIRPPLVVWIQGILDVYQHHYFGSMRCLERLRYPMLLWDYHRMAARAEREREIFRGCWHFLGRTRWDAAHQARLQPQGRYYPVQECMRPEFYEAAPWRLDSACGLTIYTTTSGVLLKGTDVLLRAVALLREHYPSIRLRVAGVPERANPVARRLFRLVKELGVCEQVEFLGQLDAAQIVLELQRARVFVLPSFIENSPNSLAEAQLVGTPVVASFVGGVPDMVEDGQTGLVFQAGDSATLARQVARILGNDDLAARLASRSRKVAHERHSPARIADVLLAAYNDILSSARVPNHEPRR